MNKILLLTLALLGCAYQSGFGMKRKNPFPDERALTKRKIMESSPHGSSHDQSQPRKIDPVYVKISYSMLVGSIGRQKLGNILADNSYKILDFSSYSDWGDNRHIGEKTLLSLIEKCNNLAGLYLRNCKNVKPATFEKIFFEIVKPEHFVSLALGPDNTIELSLLIKIVSKLKNLKSIHIQNKNQIDNYVLFATANSCKSIEMVYLRNCDKVTDCGMKWIMETCSNLQSLLISNGPRLTNAAFQHAICTNLTSLYISNCQQIGDSGVAQILRTNKNLRTLALVWCPKITNKTAVRIGRNLKNLFSLDLTKTNISDVSLYLIYKTCKKLGILAINRCPHITNRSIIFAANNFPELRGLYATDCPQITDCKEIHNLSGRNNRPIIVLFDHEDHKNSHSKQRGDSTSS